MSLAFIVFALILVIVFVIRAPLGYGMFAAGIVYLLIEGRDLGVVGQVVMGRWFSMYVLLAIPLFIVGAQIMNDSKVTSRIFQFADGLVGRFHGGLAQVNVLNSVIFSGMSGSAIADASGTGLIEVRAMVDRGYPKAFAAATTAATATLGPIIPPSIPLVIYGSIASVSVGVLFMAGIFPGLLLAGLQMLLVRYISKRRGYPRETWPGMGQLIGLTIAAVPALLAPVILLGGIYTGVFTPTEAAAVATLYALLLAFLVYRSMTLKALWRVLQVSVRQSSVVMVVIGGAFLVNYIVATEGIPQVAAAWLLSVTSDPLPLVILIMAVFLIIGMFLDGTLILLIMVPVVLPALTAAGVDLVYFGILIVFNLMIGMCTPPFGLLLFVVSTTTRTPLRDIITEIRPQLGVMLIALLVLTLVPELTLWVPHLMGYEG
jgi:tripartite ATP-independent transporter DctM subunit